MTEFERTTHYAAAYGTARGCLTVLEEALKYDDAYLRSCVERMVDLVKQKDKTLFQNDKHRTLVHADGNSVPHATD
jgi:hypothetical protein